MNDTNQANQTQQKRMPNSVASQYRFAIRIAWIAGLFSVSVLIFLIVNFAQRPAWNPADSPKYVELKNEVKADPQNEKLKEQIRDMDLQQRTDFFLSRDVSKYGAMVLLLFVIVWLSAMKFAAKLNEKLPEPEPKCCGIDQDAIHGPIARVAVAVLGAVVLGFIVGITCSTTSEIALLYKTPVVDNTTEEPINTTQNRTNQNPDTPQVKPTPVQIAPFPTAEEMDMNWPTFRSADGSGHSRYDNIPTTWDVETGVNILWKIPITLPGKNSPVIWGNRLYISGADETTRKLFCYDANSGDMVWSVDAPGTPESTAEPVEVSEDTGFAAPTLAVDGRCVYAMFGNGDVCAADMDGKIVWSRSLGMPDNMYGHSASLALHEDLLIVQYDQASDSDGLSNLYGLETTTGKSRWETPREVGSSWSSPVVVQIDGFPQIITAAVPWVIAYDPLNGKEIWRAEACDGDMGPTPVALGNMVFTATEYLQLSAIDATGMGDVTETHIKWIGDMGLPDTSSPLVNPDLKQVYVLESSGYLTAYDVETGEMSWEAETDAAGAYSSAGLAGGLLYLFGPDGLAYVIKPSSDGAEIVAECPMGEDCPTSPAFQDGRIYILGKEHLFCIGTQ